MKIIYFIFIVIVFYLISEFFIKNYGHKFFPVLYEMRYVDNQLSNNKNFLEQWDINNKKDFDKDIGWIRKFNELNFYKNLNNQNKKKISLFGSSNGVERNTDGTNEKIAYIDILNHLVNNKEYKIINHSIGNHGILQLAYSAKKSIKKYNSNLLLVATVAHTLIRPGKNYMSFMIRPQYEFTKENIHIKKNDYDVQVMLREYIFAKKYKLLFPWFIKFIYENRRYYFAFFYKEFYKKTFKSTLKLVSEAAKENNSNAAIVILPTHFNFYNKNLIIKIFKEVMDKRSKNLNVDYYDIDTCVKNYFKKNKKSFERHTTPVHPGNFTHIAWGNCIYDIILKKY